MGSRLHYHLKVSRGVPRGAGGGLLLGGSNAGPQDCSWQPSPLWSSSAKKGLSPLAPHHSPPGDTQWLSPSFSLPDDSYKEPVAGLRPPASSHGRRGSSDPPETRLHVKGGQAMCGRPKGAGTWWATSSNGVMSGLSRNG